MTENQYQYKGANATLLGTPKSQGELAQDKRIRENMKYIDWDEDTFDEIQDAFEDRDPTEFM